MMGYTDPLPTLREELLRCIDSRTARKIKDPTGNRSDQRSRLIAGLDVIVPWEQFKSAMCQAGIGTLDDRTAIHNSGVRLVIVRPDNTWEPVDPA